MAEQKKKKMSQAAAASQKAKNPKKQKEKRTVIPCAFYVFNLLSAKNYLIAVMWGFIPLYQ